jgi:hypothetical protein
MSKNIVHVTKCGVHLMGDSRGIITPHEKIHEITAWAQKNNITIQRHGYLDSKDLWYVKNEKHRTWFLLRWA